MHQWNPEDYHQSSSEQQRWARELMEKLNLKGNERVLDIGCGDGKITAEIARQLTAGSVLGIDSSEEMIRFAQKNFPPEKTPRLTFRLCDAAHLEFQNEFDVAVSFACLHWVKDHLPVLKRITRSLKPSGKVMLQFGGKGNAAAMLDVVSKVTASAGWSRYFENFVFPWGFYAPEEYREWLSEAGFQVKRIELVPKDMMHRGKEGLIAWFRTTWHPYTARIPQEQRQEFIQEVVGRYVESYPPDEEGMIHLPMVRLEVEATKPPMSASALQD